MQRFLLILFFFIQGFLNAQVIEYHFIDKKSGEDIQNVKVFFQIWSPSNKLKKDTSFVLIANQKGIVSFPKNAVLLNSVISLKAVHPLYQDVIQSKRIGVFKSDTLSIEIEMKADDQQEIKEVIIKAPGIPDTVFQSEKLSVADFEIQKDGRIILLTYPKQLKKGGDILLFDGQDVLATFPVDDNPQKLIRDFRGNTHVVCENNIFTLQSQKNNLFLASIEKDYFIKYIVPIVDTNRTKMYLNNFNEVFPAFDYFTFDKLDSSYRKLMHIEDEWMMELYKSEYKWMDVRTKLWAKNKEYETGIEAEVWVGANYFTQSLYYQEAYAPLFHRNDSLFIFDYAHDQLTIFSSWGRALDTIPIYYHYNPTKTGWKKNMIQDKETGAFYGVFETNGYSYLGLIDVTSGKIINKVKLAFKYVDKIRVNNNFVYYVYRPFESTQKKYLYKEQLPYFLPNGSVFQQPVSTKQD
jgi:hypothetical protein